MTTITETQVNSTNNQGQQPVGGPLAKALDSRYKLGTYQYPQNLGADPSRQHVVKFFINVINNSNYVFDNNQYNTTNVNQSQTERTFNTGNPQFDNALRDANLKLSPPTTKIASTIALYMPDTVNVQYNNSYQDDNLSDYAIPRYGQGLSDIMNSYDGNKKMFDNIKNILSGNPAVLDLLRATPIGDSLPLDILLKGRGYAVNPQVQLLFKATELRSFQLDFLFTPYSESEAKSVRNIIEQFKFHAAPEIGGGAANASGLFFIPPSTFNVEFYFNGSINNNIHKIGECVLENINVDYAPSGWITFLDGNPVQTRMTLQFKEVDIITKAKIQEGY